MSEVAITEEVEESPAPQEAPQRLITMSDQQGNRLQVPLEEAEGRWHRGELGFFENVPVAVINPTTRSHEVLDGGDPALPRMLRAGYRLLGDEAADASVERQRRIRASGEYNRRLQENYGGAGQMATLGAERVLGGLSFGLSDLAAQGVSELAGETPTGRAGEARFSGAEGTYEQRARARAMASPDATTAFDIAAIPAAFLAPVPGATGAAVARAAGATGRLGRGLEAASAGMGALVNPLGVTMRQSVRLERSLADGIARGYRRVTGQSVPRAGSGLQALAAQAPQGATRGQRVAHNIRSAAQLAPITGVSGAVAATGEGFLIGVADALRDARMTGTDADIAQVVSTGGVDGASTGALWGGGIGASIGFLASPAVRRAVNDRVDNAFLYTNGMRLSGDEFRSRAYGGNAGAAYGSLLEDLRIVTRRGTTRASIIDRAEGVVSASDRRMRQAAEGAEREGARLADDAIDDLMRASDSLPQVSLEAGARRWRSWDASDITATAREALAPLASAASRGSLAVARQARINLDQLLAPIKAASRGQRKGTLAEMRDSLFKIRRDLENAIELSFASIPNAQRAAQLQRRYVDAAQNYSAAKTAINLASSHPTGVLATLFDNANWPGARQVADFVQSSPGRRAKRVLFQGAAGGSLAGFLGGSTIAGILTGAFGGIALRAGSRQLPWLSAYALQKLGLRRQARIVQEEARQSLGTILGPRREWRPDPKLMASVAGSVAVSAYDRDTEAVRQRVESPEPALQRAADRAPRDMPEATVALVNSEGSQLETLERAMPRGLGELTLRSHAQNPDRLVSDVEKAAWMRVKRGVADPLSLIEDIKSGMLTYDTVMAVRDSHPDVYAMLKEEVRELIQSRDNPPPYAVLLELDSMFPELPTHPSLVPGMIQLLQAPFMARETGSVGGQMSQGPGPAPQQPAPNVAKLEETRVQQIDSQ